jgi:hypothetical protein
LVGAEVNAIGVQALKDRGALCGITDIGIYAFPIIIQQSVGSGLSTPALACASKPWIYCLYYCLCPAWIVGSCSTGRENKSCDHDHEHAELQFSSSFLAAIFQEIFRGFNRATEFFVKIEAESLASVSCDLN